MHSSPRGLVARREFSGWESCIRMLVVDMGWTGVFFIFEGNS